MAMVMSPLDKKLLRDLWRMKGQAIAIAAVIACAVATLVMSFGTVNSLQETRTAFYERSRFADVFAPVKRAPDALAARIAGFPGVRRVATRIVQDVTLDISDFEEPMIGRLVSIPESRRPALNDLVIGHGRYIEPDHPDEVLLHEAFAEAHGLHPGDTLWATINGRKRTLRIVGIALSPEYVYAIGPGVLVPDNRRFGVLWMGREALAAAFDLDAAFNDVTLALLPGASSADVIKRLDDLLEAYGGAGAYDRQDQISDSYLRSELDGNRVAGSIIPPMFLIVAAFLLNHVMSRLIDAEREQIGLLKAFGYRNGAIVWHYLQFALIITAAGIILGYGGGLWVGRSVTEIYAEFYRFPVLYYRPGAAVFAAASLLSLAVATAASTMAVRRAARLQPAVAMQPPAPVDYRGIAAAPLSVARLLDMPTRMVLRHIARWPGRSAVTTTGIAMAVAILVGTLFFFDSMDEMMESYFHRQQRQDATITFVEPKPDRAVEALRRLPGVLTAEPYRTVAARIRLGHRSERTEITGIDEDAALRPPPLARPRPPYFTAQRLVLSSELADNLRARPGDRVRLEVLQERRPVLDIEVAAITEEYIGKAAYMDRRALNRLMREGAMSSGAYLLLDQTKTAPLYRELKDTPQIASIMLQSKALNVFRETMAETMYIIIGFYVAFGSLIAIGVVYNSARISLSEHARDLATLRVIGYTRHEVSYILLGQLSLLTLLALPVGCLLGYGLAWMFVQAFHTEVYRIPLHIEPATYGLAILTVLIAAIASALLVRRRIDRLDLVSVLKTRE